MIGASGNNSFDRPRSTQLSRLGVVGVTVAGHFDSQASNVASQSRQWLM